jgi:hypothetical protein
LKVTDENSRIRIQDPDPDPLVRGMDPRIRIHPKMSWILNTGHRIYYFRFLNFHSVFPLSLFMGLFVIQSFLTDILVVAPHQCNDKLKGCYGVITYIVLHQRLMFWYTYLVGLDIHKMAGDKKLCVESVFITGRGETDYKKVKNLVTMAL